MKLKWLLFVCLGLAVGFSSCSKDDDDEDGNPSNNGGSQESLGPEEDPNLYKYYGAELYSKETFKYGRFEAKMKMAYAPGCISSMFLYYNDSYKGGTYVWNEIDIEVLGKDSYSFQSNIISGSASAKVTSEMIHNLSSPLNKDYHVYVMEWTPDYVSWSLDGKEVRRTVATSEVKKQVSKLVEKQSLRFNLWAVDNVAWVGKFDSRYIPIAQYIDYVKVSDYDEATGTFTERWTDDFDTFETSRWSKGNWQMEKVYETPNNVVVEDGKLVLKLTKELK